MANTENVLQMEGEVVEVGGNVPLWLDDPGSAWMVSSGAVDVFAVRAAAGEPVGPRHHLFRAGSGQVLFGVAPGGSAGDVALLARGIAGTRLLKLRRAHLCEVAAEPGRAGEVVGLVEGWVSGLSSGLAKSLTPSVFTALEPDREVKLAANRVARPKTGVLWVSHLEGNSRFLGRAELSTLNGAGFFPLSPVTWLLADGSNTIAAIPTERVLAQDPEWLCLDSFHKTVLECVALNTELEEVAERERLKKKLSSDRLYVENAVARLASVFESGSEAVFLGDDIGDDVEEPLFTACRLVGTALGVEMRPRPDPIDGRAEAQTLDGIARASRVRTRQVALRGEWWRQDNGPLLAFTEDGKRPVALLPASPRRYELLDPMAQSRTPVTREVADTLEPFAHSFYRTFPERLLTTRDLIELGLRGAGRDLATIVLTGIAGGVLALLVPVTTGIIFDSLIPAAERAQLVQLSLALIVSALTAAAFQVVRSVAVLRLEGRIDTSIQAAVWDRLLSLPVPFFRDYSAGDLAVRAMGINAIRQTLTGATLSTLLSAVFSIFSFGLLFVYSVRLALVATALVLVYVALATTAGYVQVRYQRRMAEIEGRLSGMVLQFLSGISKLRVAGAEGRAFARWADEFSDKRKLAFRARAVGNRVAVLNAAYPVLATLIVFVMVVLSGGAGLSTGSFLAFNAAFVQFMAAMLAVSSSAISILGVVPFYERAKPILHTRPEVDRAKADPGELSGEIEVSHVSFRYAPDTPLILKNVSLRINPGEFVALVGPSGSGKSTLFRLLLGFEMPESGAVYYNGYDLAGLDMRLVRRKVGVVLQHGKLMPGDIYTNIVGASSTLTLEDAWEAARMAGFDEDIKRMPMGMHTVLSEGGGTLSGGQRQRLLVARAIVNRPRILFFDEATSALDNKTQAIVSESLERLKATRIVIAHRLSTIINADRIVVVKDGQIVQQGRYEELANQEGLFAELVRRQLA